jgi:hypothetical protein
VEKQVMGGESYHIAATPAPLASALHQDFAEVQQTCRIGRHRAAGVFQNGAKTAEPANMLIVDNAFFSLFDFHLIRGNARKALLGPMRWLSPSARPNSCLEKAGVVPTACWAGPFNSTMAEPCCWRA